MGFKEPENLFYDIDGTSLKNNIWDASLLLADIDLRRVAETRLLRSRISTVFLVIDHGFSSRWDDGELTGPPPILFETMVFGGICNEECRRYATREEAVKGHKKMVALVIFRTIQSLLWNRITVMMMVAILVTLSTLIGGCGERRPDDATQGRKVDSGKVGAVLPGHSPVVGQGWARLRLLER